MPLELDLDRGRAPLVVARSPAREPPRPIPFPTYPSRLGGVFRTVWLPTSDYASEVLDDGTILLRQHPGSSALALAGWYKKSAPIGPALVDALVAAMKEHPRYRPLEVPAAPCRSDATTSTATRGELTFDDGARVTLFTCSLTKHGDAYSLAWAARTKDVGADERRLQSMLKGSQLVPNDLCVVNVINGGCAPSASGMLAALVENARR